MKNLSFLLFYSSIISFLKFFKKKLTSLMIMEIMIISVIMFCVFWSCNIFMKLLVTFIFMLFMVVDSTLGVSILISSSRNSAESGMSFSSI